jgi:hypothetical protein
MIIVAGKIYVRSGARHEFLASSFETVVQAPKSSGCRDLRPLLVRFPAFG